jgi:hypothetical protein
VEPGRDSRLGLKLLILAEVQTPQSVAPERILDELFVAAGAEIETERLRAAVFQLQLPGLFDFLQGLGDGLQMIGIELFFVDLFGIEAGIDLDPDDISLVTQLS